MPAVSLTDTYDTLLTTTLAMRSRQLWDSLSRGLQILKIIEADKNKNTGVNGHRVEIPLLYGANTTVGHRSDYDVVDTSKQDGITLGFIPWKDLSGSITISDREVGMNGGKEKVLGILDSRMKQLEVSMRNQLNTDLAGDGTTANAVFGLQYWIRTSTATVASIDDSVNTWWQNKSITSVGSFAANGRDKMRTLRNNCSLGANTDTPTDIYTDQTTYEYFEKTLDPIERYTLEKSGPDELNVGVDVLNFHGAKLTWDADAPSGNMYFLNARDNKIQWNVLEGGDFQTGPFVRPSNQRVKTAIMTVTANVTMTVRKRMGVLTGITA